MLAQLQDRIQFYVKTIGDPGDTLEIGSYNVNGEVRYFFPQTNEYVGSDMREGPGVDLVINSHDLLDFFGEDRFDTIVWLETMEHDDAFWVTMRNINHLIRPYGHVMISAPTIGFGKHDYPSDYWRFTEDGFRVLLRGWTILEISRVEPYQTIAALARRDRIG